MLTTKVLNLFVIFVTAPKVVVYINYSSRQLSKLYDAIKTLQNKSIITFAAYRIPKGWKLICWARYFHTNPENFENPLGFNPDRWDVSKHHINLLCLAIEQ